MNTSMEVQVLQCFERALAQPPDRRKDWLSAQDLAPGVRDRVRQLLDAEPAAAATR